MDTLYFFTLREEPYLLAQAAEWFHKKWNIPTAAYEEHMDDYITYRSDYGWYLCMEGDRIVGGLGVVENDFHNRKDLSPNICAVYVDENVRGRGIMGQLLELAVEDLRDNGITPVYLFTDHCGLYEKYGWEFHSLAQGDSDEYLSRVYVHY